MYLGHGSDNGERSKRPATCVVLLTPPVSQEPAPRSAQPGRVLDYGQDVGLGAVKQVGCEEVAGQDRLGLGAQELPPGRSGSS
jgi:hypothetical protein